MPLLDVGVADEVPNPQPEPMTGRFETPNFRSAVGAAPVPIHSDESSFWRGVTTGRHQGIATWYTGLRLAEQASLGITEALSGRVQNRKDEVSEEEWMAMVEDRPMLYKPGLSQAEWRRLIQVHDSQVIAESLNRQRGFSAEVGDFIGNLLSSMVFDPVALASVPISGGIGMAARSMALTEKFRRFSNVYKYFDKRPLAAGATVGGVEGLLSMPFDAYLVNQQGQTEYTATDGTIQLLASMGLGFLTGIPHALKARKRKAKEGTALPEENTTDPAPTPEAVEQMQSPENKPMVDQIQEGLDAARVARQKGKTVTEGFDRDTAEIISEEYVQEIPDASPGEVFEGVRSLEEDPVHPERGPDTQPEEPTLDESVESRDRPDTEMVDSQREQGLETEYTGAYEPDFRMPELEREVEFAGRTIEFDNDIDLALWHIAEDTDEGVMDALERVLRDNYEVSRIDDELADAIEDIALDLFNLVERQILEDPHGIRMDPTGTSHLKFNRTGNVDRLVAALDEKLDPVEPKPAAAPEDLREAAAATRTKAQDDINEIVDTALERGLINEEEASMVRKDATLIADMRDILLDCDGWRT